MASENDLNVFLNPKSVAIIGAKLMTTPIAGICQGLFRQAGIVSSPTMELLLPLAHALIERPPMRGNRVGIITIGGSWGVALTDALVEAQLRVPEFSGKLQNALRSLGMPDRASIRNPVDFGASGMFFSTDVLLAIGWKILSSGEVDALILHGVGRGGCIPTRRRKNGKFFWISKSNRFGGLPSWKKRRDCRFSSEAITIPGKARPSTISIRREFGFTTDCMRLRI